MASRQLRIALHKLINYWGLSAVTEALNDALLSKHNAGSGEYPAHEDRWLRERENREVEYRDE